MSEFKWSDAKAVERKSCRVCGSEDLEYLFSLGEHYLNNFLDVGEDPGKPVPITLELCRNCSLVQMKHTAPQELLYTRNYWYRSGVTDTMRVALKDVVDSAISCIDTATHKFGNVQLRIPVLDIGSNDGTLLRHYNNSRFYTIGFEPATNLAKQGSQGVDKFYGEFWNANTFFGNSASPLADSGTLISKAKIITACGMFYDLENPKEFIKDVARVLHKDGVFVAQLMCLRNMININDIGNLAHEHLEFYSLKSLDHLLNKHGLEIFDLETNRVNGESYRLFIRHKHCTTVGSPGETESLTTARLSELNLSDPNFYTHFFSRMERNKEKVVSFIKREVSAGKKVWVYGASTKGNTILQYYGLDSSLIEGASDRSPEKWGKFTVGTGIKIYSEDHAREVNPDYFLVLPYAFLDEFLVREQSWRDGGGKFIVPLPEFKLV